MDIQQESDKWHELPSVVGSPNWQSRSDSLDSCSCAADPVTQEEFTNPLKKIVVKAVLDGVSVVFQ